MARAIATRWRWPPDISCGKRLAYSEPRPTSASTSSTRRRVAAEGMSSSMRRPSPTSWPMVMRGSSDE
ncbi:hypothetical protein G6F55_014708 [Rhizopus delemar]|nr:hypothetical protein G6F55_014708 [Rhizopus delemar]